MTGYTETMVKFTEWLYERKPQEWLGTLTTLAAQFGVDEDTMAEVLKDSENNLSAVRRVSGGTSGPANFFASLGTFQFFKARHEHLAQQSGAHRAVPFAGLRALLSRS